MPKEASDRNLLFGILALKLDFISRDALIDAMNAWSLDKAKPLGDILVEQKALSAELNARLQALMLEHIKQHNNDPQQSLAAIGPVGDVKKDLEQIADPDLQASMGALPASSADKGEDPNLTVSVGTPTATGLRFRILRPHARGGLGFQHLVALHHPH